jgi:hypothetical protein
MPKVVLEFEVTDKGLAGVPRLLTETESALRRLGKGSESMAKDIGRTDASVRELARGAKLFGAILLADVNPALAQSIMNFQSLAQASRLAGSAITGGLVVAAAAGVAALVHYTQQTNQAIEFQARLDESVRRFDVSGMTGQLKALGLELEIEEKKAQAFLGGLKIFGGFEGFQGFEESEVSTIGETLAEGKLKKFRENMEKVRKEIERITPLFFEQQVINLSTKLRAAQSDRALMTGPSASRGAEIVDRLQREERDAKRIIDLQTEIAKGQAATEKERLQISVLGSYQRLIVEEETKTKILAAQRAQAAEELAMRTADLRQSASIRAALEGGELAIRMADLRNDWSARAALEGENQARQLANAERLHASLLAMLQGYFAQGLIGEKEFTDQRRQLQAEWVQSNAAALTRAATDYQKYRDQIRSLDKEMRKAKEDTADILAGIKQVGMTPAEAFADRERRAQEELARAMKLSGQEQVEALKAVQGKYADLAMQAAQAEAAQKKAWDWSGTAAARAWWESQPGAKSTSAQTLADQVAEIGRKLEAAYAAARLEAKAAAENAKHVADETERNLRAVQASVGSVSDLADAYRAAAAAARSIPAPPTPGGGGGGGRDPWVLPPQIGPQGTWSSGGSMPPWTGEFVPELGPGEGGPGGGTFQHGGFVPPTPPGWGGRREFPVMAEAGELILNAREQAVLRNLVGQGAGGAPITINIEVNGSQEDPETLARRIARNVGQELVRQQRLGLRPINS